MPAKTNAQLKEAFLTGQPVTQDALYNLIDSMRNVGVMIAAADINGLSDYFAVAYTDEAKTTTQPIMTGFRKYAVKTSGTFPNFLNASAVALAVTADDLNEKSVEFWGRDGVFEKVVLTTSGNFMTRSKLTLKGAKISYTAYIKNGYYLASNGAEGQNSDRKMISKIPLTTGKTYEVGPFPDNTVRTYAWLDASNAVISTGTLNAAYPSTDKITPPSNMATFSCNLTLFAGAADPVPAFFIREYFPAGSTATQYDGFDLEAKAIATNAYAPEPTTASNPATKNYVDTKAVAKATVEFSVPANLAGSPYWVSGKYINSAGTIVSADGWGMWAIPVVANQYVSLANYTISGGGYLGCYDSNNQYVTGTVQAIGPTVVNKTVQALQNGILYIDGKRPADADSARAQAVIVYGQTVPAWTDPEPKIIKIMGYQVAGAGSSSVANFSDLKDVVGYLGNAGKALRVKSNEAGLEYFAPVAQNEDAVFGTVTCGGLSITGASQWDGVSTPAPVAVGKLYYLPDGTVKRRMV